MILDNANQFAALDSSKLLHQIDQLPEQLEQGWKYGLIQPLPAFQSLSRVVLVGAGSSAAAAELLARYIEPFSTIPVIVYCDYVLPAWAAGPETLVVAISFAGNSEESLTAIDQAHQAGCSILGITTGGMLSEGLTGAGYTVWQYAHPGPSRMAVGVNFGLLLALVFRLGLIPNPSKEIDEAVKALRSQKELIQAQSPVNKNPAKRMAGQMMGRWITVVGAGVLQPVARRWKEQLNELAKSGAQFEVLPNLDYNFVEGTTQPVEVLPHSLVIFLRSSADHPRNQLRSQLTQQHFMLEGVGTDFVNASGESRLAQLWTLVQFGDYSAYYLAMAYGVDPGVVPAIDQIKSML